MRRVAERGEIRVVRGDNPNQAARPHEPVEFLHRFHDVGDMLDDVHSVQFVETVIAERVGEPVEVTQYIGAAAWIAVHANRARTFVAAAADVQDPGFAHRFSVSRAAAPAGDKP